MKESEKHHAEIEDECNALETADRKTIVQSATKILTLIGLKAQAIENEKLGDAPRGRGRPRIRR